MTFKVPSHPNHSMILRFYKSLGKHTQETSFHILIFQLVRICPKFHDERRCSFSTSSSSAAQLGLSEPRLQAGTLTFRPESGRRHGPSRSWHRDHAHGEKSAARKAGSWVSSSGIPHLYLHCSLPPRLFPSEKLLSQRDVPGVGRINLC